MEKHTPATTRREVTLRDVAAAAGVSVWTASNTYSNPGRVAEATRQRVHAAARALGYPGPHPGARSLARGQTGMIAFVAVDDAEVLLGDPAAALVSRGLLTACERAGCSLVLSGLATGQPVDARAFFRVAGVPDPRVPTVVVDGAAPAGAHAVTADVRGAAAAVASHLSDLGHLEVAVLAWHGAEERLSGVEHGWRGRRPMRTFMEPPAETTRRGRGAVAWPDRAVGEVLARAALSSRPRPTAVLALSDTLALSTLSVAHWMGLRVPEDVSIAGVDDLPGSEAIGLTSALVPYRPLGERAGDLLTAVLAGGEPPPTPDLPTALSIRRTTGPPAPPR